MKLLLGKVVRGNIWIFQKETMAYHKCFGTNRYPEWTLLIKPASWNRESPCDIDCIEASNSIAIVLNLSADKVLLQLSVYQAQCEGSTQIILNREKCITGRQCPIRNKLKGNICFYRTWHLTQAPNRNFQRPVHPVLSMLSITADITWYLKIFKYLGIRVTKESIQMNV